MQDIELTGSQEVLDELQKGRTRELLLLLQDKPVPEVQNPLNLQSNLSLGYESSGSDYEIGRSVGSKTARDADDSNSPYAGKYGIKFTPNQDASGVWGEVSSNTDGYSKVYLLDSDKNVLKSTYEYGSPAQLTYDLISGTTYYLAIDDDGSDYTQGFDDDPSFPYTGSGLDMTAGLTNGNTVSGVAPIWREMALLVEEKNAYVTDQFAAPTTAPADFKQWNALRAQDVTVGGSTSANPVEFEILDSSDTVLTSSRIPASEIADEPFRLREREYSTTAGSDGQADYQIPETGNGGHYGIPILSVVTVSVAGNVLDPSNWTFDPTTNTVSIDTSSVTVTSEDTVTISYDFDLFDSTLQPRAYLRREDTSETSPSISHFRYEYVI